MRIASKTDVGLVRSNNQDSFVAGPIGDNSAWAVVCDGMGGVGGGNIASSLAIKTISDAVISSFRTNMTSNSIRNLFKSAFSAANVKILNRSREDEALKGMGTTAVAVVVCENIAHIVHVGDSRAYILRNGDLMQITRDHSIVQSMLEQGEIDVEQAKHHPRKNIITRAIGVLDSIEPEYNEIEINDSDVILLCTDGLTNFVEDNKIKQILCETDFDNIPSALINEANANGGGDNITAVVLAYQKR